MIISIASGKGGTGKTTLAVNLTYALEDNVQMLDCDVEEPNGHLFLNRDIQTEYAVNTTIPLVDQSRCSLCGECADICQFNAIVVAGNSVLTFPKMCHSCGGCTLICPEKAISEQKREIGKIRTGSVKQALFTEGILNIGETMSPPLIKVVKAEIKSEKVNIIDAPPGTSCPVVTAMSGSDYVLMVTEPTPFGLHDLKLAVEAAEKLNIPCGLVINRSDLGDDQVKKYAEEKGLPVLLEIPYLREIAEIYSRGELFAEILPEWREKLLDMFSKIEQNIQGGYLI
jgi:MinD superfamily P-loop ATPase